MQLISGQIKGFLDKSSWIRKMFEAGIEMKKEFGADNVYDFSLGNPDLPPPEGVGHALFRMSTTLEWYNRAADLGHPDANYRIIFTARV